MSLGASQHPNVKETTHIEAWKKIKTEARNPKWSSKFVSKYCVLHSMRRNFMSLFIQVFSLHNPIKFLAILHPKSLANLVVEVRTRHSPEILFQQWIGARLWEWYAVLHWAIDVQVIFGYIVTLQDFCCSYFHYKCECCLCSSFQSYFGFWIKLKISKDWFAQNLQHASTTAGLYCDLLRETSVK